VRRDGAGDLESFRRLTWNAQHHGGAGPGQMDRDRHVVGKVPGCEQAFDLDDGLLNAGWIIGEPRVAPIDPPGRLSGSKNDEAVEVVAGEGGRMQPG
jgi:hypothetical protein